MTCVHFSRIHACKSPFIFIFIFIFIHNINIFPHTEMYHMRTMKIKNLIQDKLGSGQNQQKAKGPQHCLRQKPFLLLNQRSGGRFFHLYLITMPLPHNSFSSNMCISNIHSNAEQAERRYFEVFCPIRVDKGRRMIPHFLSPILLCRRQVASITLGPHLIRGRPPTDRRISLGAGH